MILLPLRQLPGRSGVSEEQFDAPHRCRRHSSPTRLPVFISRVRNTHGPSHLGGGQAEPLSRCCELSGRHRQLLSPQTASEAIGEAIPLFPDLGGDRWLRLLESEPLGVLASISNQAYSLP